VSLATRPAGRKIRGCSGASINVGPGRRTGELRRSARRDDAARCGWEDIQSALDLNVSAPVWCAREFVAQHDGNRRAPSSAFHPWSVTAFWPGARPLRRDKTRAARAHRRSAERDRRPRAADKSRADLTRPHGHSLASPARQRSRGRESLSPRTARPRDIADAVLYVLATPPTVQVSDILIRSSAQPY